MRVHGKQNILFITFGKSYQVLDDKGLEYKIVDDISSAWHLKESFYTEGEWREIQLSKILENV